MAVKNCLAVRLGVIYDFLLARMKKHNHKHVESRTF
jgi:predicted secreted Zn-dependent protease